MKLFQKTQYLLQFLLKSVSRNGIRRYPEFLEFYDHVIDGDKYYYAFKKLDLLRAQLEQDLTLLDIVDYGAGSSYGQSPKKSVSKLVNQQVSSSYQLRLIWRLIYLFKCKNILELGSSIGLSSMYLGSVFSDSTVDVLEGNEHFVRFGKKMAKSFPIDTLHFYTGKFVDTLDYVLERKRYDLVFIDGHHERQATFDYYKKILPHLHKDSIVIFDDIYWSKGMKEVWEMIKLESEVTYSIDLYFMGIIFFNSKSNKHIKLRPKKLY